MNLVFLGPPGSGKGTMAKLISKKLGCCHISTGDLFRENIEKQTFLGIKVKNIVESGKLVPDSITIQIVKEKLFKINQNKKSFILDGFPRNILQAEELDKITKNIKIINFTIHENELIKRSFGRRICSYCKNIYNIYTLPPKINGICNVCKQALYQRKDDKEDSLKIRLEEYQLQTKILVNYYSKESRLNNIDASLDISKIEKKIFEIIR